MLVRYMQIGEHQETDQCKPTQVERFACLYTSKVSNKGLYSPEKYYRPSEDFMPREFDIIAS